MRTLDRYVASSFLGSFILLMLVGVMFFVTIDMILNLDEFLKDPDASAAAVLSAMLDYYAGNLPMYFAQFCGPVMGVAGAFALAMMLRNNELTAVLSAGVPLQRLAAPILVCSIPIVALSILNSELLIPAVAHKLVRDRDALLGARTLAARCIHDDNKAILQASELDPRAGRMERVFIIEPDAAGNPANLIEADAAVWDESRRTWKLDRGTRYVVGDVFGAEDLGRAIERQPLAEYAFTLSPTEIVLRQSAQWSELMSISEMNELVRSRHLPNRPALIRSRDVRFTRPLLMWILLALSLPFFLSRQPTNVLRAGAYALLLTGLCFGFTFLAQSVSADLGARARLAYAMPVLFFGPLAILRMANVKT